MLTKTDLKLIKLLMEEIRDDILIQTDKNIDKKLDRFKHEINEELSQLRREFRKEMAETKAELKNDIFTFKDEIIGEIRNVHIDSEIIRSYNDQLENHDSRITKLEQSSN